MPDASLRRVQGGRGSPAPCLDCHRTRAQFEDQYRFSWCVPRNDESTTYDIGSWSPRARLGCALSKALPQRLELRAELLQLLRVIGGDQIFVVELTGAAGPVEAAIEQPTLIKNHKFMVHMRV